MTSAEQLAEMREAFNHLQALAESYRIRLLNAERENEELRAQLRDANAHIAAKFWGDAA